MDYPVACGVEVECFISPSQLPGDPSHLSRIYFEALCKAQHAVVSDGRVYWRQGGAYIELKEFLEFMSTPCRTVAGTIESMSLCCGMARYAHRLVLKLGEAPQVRAVLCLPDDLRGPAPYYAIGSLVSRSVGFHCNFTNLIESDAMLTSRRLATVACLLSEICGSGGFVRDELGRLVFWRDPRAAHVVGPDRPGKRFRKPLMKSLSAFGRHQVIGLGFTLARCDATIRFACLFAAVLAKETDFPSWRLPIESLSTPPGVKFRYVEDGEGKSATKLDLLERFLTEVATPLCDTDAGLLAGIKEGIELALLAVQTIRREAEIDVAATIPLGWAVKYAAFAHACERRELATPSNGKGQRGPIVEELAMISVLEGDLINPDPIRRKLLNWAGLEKTVDSVWLDPIHPGPHAERLPTGLSPVGWELAAACERRQPRINWAYLNRPLPSHLAALGRTKTLLKRLKK